MKKQNIIVFGVIVVIFSAYFLLNRDVDLQSMKNSSLTEPSLTLSLEWKTYENMVYHFKVKYPQNGLAQKVSETDPTPDEESADIEITIPGGRQHFHIKTYDPKRELVGVEETRATMTDIKSFAETARQKEISDKNQNFPNKKVGKLKETVFVNEKAFSYIITGSSDGYGNDDSNYIFFEHRGIIFAVSYPTNDQLSQVIADTLEFTEK